METKRGGLLEVALAYERAGLCVLPAIPAQKRPDCKDWKRWQTQRPNPTDLKRMRWRAGGICLVCGAVSGQLELLDFDVTVDQPGGEVYTVYERWRELVEAAQPGLVQRLVRERSQRGGQHIVYRVSGEPVPPNQKLASHSIRTPDKHKVEINGKGFTPIRVGDGWAVEHDIIETRGEGGLFLCAPTPGYTLESGRFEELPTITAAERAVLMLAARSLDELPQDPPEALPPPSAKPRTAGKLSVGEDYTLRGPIEETLTKHGWVLHHTDAKQSYWRRPGKDQGYSATLRRVDGGKQWFFSFTDSAPPLVRVENGYSAWAVYTLLEHGGDFKASARALGDQGYGEQKLLPPRRPKEEKRELEKSADVEAGKVALAELRRKAAAGEETCIVDALADSDTVDALATLFRLDRPQFSAGMMGLSAKELRHTIRAGWVNELAVAVRARAEQQTQREAALRARQAAPELVPVVEVAKKAPVIPKLVVPLGYTLTAAGIYEHVYARGVTRPELVTSTPILIAGRLIDVESEAITLVLAWFDGKRWRKLLIDREKLAQAAEIVPPLAAVGVHVDSHNKMGVIRWLAAFEQANRDALPSLEATTRLGWLGSERFVLADCIVDEEGIHEQAPDDPRQWGKKGVALRGMERGERDVLAGYHSKGTFEGWKRVVSAVADYPAAMLAVYASLASPLLHILRVDPMFIEWADETSTGKTTAVMLGASTAGCARESGAGSVLVPWSSSLASLDRRLVLLNHVPVYMDDTRKCELPEKLVSFVYNFSGGGQRGRATQTGLQAQSSWRCTMLSNGEHKITDFADDQAGMFARVVCVTAPPFGPRSDETARRIEELREGLDQHYGHALPRFVHYLIRTRAQWAAIRAEHQQARAGFMSAYREQAGERGANLAHRLIDYLAAIQVTIRIAQDALRLNWEPPDVWELVRSSVIESVRESDRVQVALALVVEWAAAHADRFVERLSEHDPAETQTWSSKPPPLGWAGRWDRRLNANWEWLGVTTETLRGVLTPYNMPWAQMVRKWRDRGWLVEGADNGRLQRTVRINTAETLPCYLISRAAVEKVLGRDRAMPPLWAEGAKDDGHEDEKNA